MPTLTSNKVIGLAAIVGGAMVVMYGVKQLKK